MKTFRHVLSLVTIFTVVTLLSCSKEEYLKSEAGIKKQLKGNWSLIPIPRTNPDQNWEFNESDMTRSENSQNYSANFSVSTSWTSAKIKLENMTIVSGTFDYNGTWDIVQLDDDFLIIANDRDGTSGIKELEFQKRK